MADTEHKAFDFAQGVVQQILTLATGITALTLTFFDQFAKHPTDWAKGILIGSWGVLSLSILAGIAALMTMTGTLQKSAKPNVYEKNIATMAAIQIVLFAVGVVLTVVAGGLAI